MTREFSQLDPAASSDLFSVHENALAKIHALMTAKNGSFHFRIGILPGGCSGFQYQFSLEESEKFSQSQDVEFCFNYRDAKIFCVMDKECLPYLKNAVIGYKSTLQESRFLVENPNAESTCGCGVSFCLK
jgi:iron-sulfur cluster assembly accessory protein